MQLGGLSQDGAANFLPVCVVDESPVDSHIKFIA